VIGPNRPPIAAIPPRAVRPPVPLRGRERPASQRRPLAAPSFYIRKHPERGFLFLLTGGSSVVPASRFLFRVFAFRRDRHFCGPVFPALLPEAADLDLKLERDQRTLFAPELEKKNGQPAAVGPEFVHDGVAGGAEGDEPRKVVDAGAAMMDGALIFRAAALAPGAIPTEDLIPQAGEEADRPAAPLVARCAKAGDRRRLAAGPAKERRLLGRITMNLHRTAIVYVPSCLNQGVHSSGGGKPIGLLLLAR